MTVGLYLVSDFSSGNMKLRREGRKISTMEKRKTKMTRSEELADSTSKSKSISNVSKLMAKKGNDIDRTRNLTSEIENVH